VWEHNPQKFKNASIEHVIQTHNTSGWTQQQIEDEAKRQFEAAAKEFWIETLRFGKQIRPNAKWGYYSTPYRNYWLSPTNQICPQQTHGVGYNDCHRELNNKMDWFWQETDVIFPSIYQLYYSVEGATTSGQNRKGDNEKYVTDMINEAKRVSQRGGGKPVIAFTWNEYHDSNQFYGGQFLNEINRNHSYVLPLELGVDGIILWGWITSASRLENTKEYFRTTLGPLIVKEHDNFCLITK
jgi:hyaluronoglucosaminidase